MEEISNGIEASDDLDVDLIRAEINAKAEEWRLVDPEIRPLERKIESEWIDIAPPGAVSRNGTLLDLLVKSGKIKADAPAESRPYIRQVKKVIHKSIRWYGQSLAGQINDILRLLVRHLREVEARLEKLEANTFPHLSDIDYRDDIPEPSASVAAMVADIVGPNKCAVLSCGEGAIVEAICNNGGSAYGVDKNNRKLLVGIRKGIDIREGDILAHISKMNHGEVSAIVLSGSVEMMPLAAIKTMVLEADRVLAQNGLIVIVVADLANRSVEEAELNVGCGLSPSTWQFLMNQCGLPTSLMPTQDTHITELVVARR